MLPNNASPTPDSELNVLLSDLLTAAKSILKENFIGMYLTGSLAVGDFDAESDVDFVIMIHERTSEEQLLELQKLHVRLHHTDIKWATCLEGYYIVQTELKHYHADAAWHLYLDNGSKDLEVVTDNQKDWVFERFVLQEYAIILEGPDPKNLFDAIPVKVLQETVFAELHRWSKEVLDNPVSLNNRWFQSFMVLSLCRMLHTLKFGRIVSKAVAMQWAKESFDPKWTRLIERAWQERPNPPLKARMRAEQEDVEATPGFIAYVLEYSRQYL
jgi:predicted nucleotidyltransferase